MRVFRHLFSYIWARGLPGSLQVATVAILTRLVTPADYGVYALALTAAGLGNAFLYQWLRQGMVRFMPGTGRSEMLATVGWGFMGMTGVACAVCVACLFLPTPSATVVGLTLLVLISLAWFDVNQELLRAEFAPQRYGLQGMFRSVISLLLMCGAVYANLGPAGILLGYAAGCLLPTLPLLAQWLRAVRTGPSRSLARQMMRYGLPFTGTMAFAFAVATLDRFLIAHLLGNASAGRYVVGVDLAQQSIGLMLAVVNLAFFPHVIQAIHDGSEALQNTVRLNGAVVFGVACAASTGIALLAPPLTTLLVGSSFRGATQLLLPWMALSAALSGLRAYHLDLSFHISCKTIPQLYLLGVMLLVNATGTLVLVPRLGLVGAAISNVGANVVGIVGSWILGRSLYRVPFDFRLAAQIALAVGVMGLTLWVTRPAPDTLGYLVLRTVLGGITLLISGWVLNLGGLRRYLQAQLHASAQQA